MFLVKTYVAKSEIHGLGVFTCGNILKGTIVWTYNPLMDKTLSIEDVLTLPLHIQEYLNTYAYIG